MEQAQRPAVVANGCVRADQRTTAGQTAVEKKHGRTGEALLSRAALVVREVFVKNLLIRINVRVGGTYVVFVSSDSWRTQFAVFTVRKEQPRTRLLMLHSQLRNAGARVIVGDQAK